MPHPSNTSHTHRDLENRNSFAFVRFLSIRASSRLSACSVGKTGSPIPRCLGAIVTATLLFLVPILTQGCGADRSPVGGNESGSGASSQGSGDAEQVVTGNTTPRTGSQGERREWSVTFTRFSNNDVEFVAVPRSVSAEAPAEAALRELLEGPTREERDQGLTTEIPEGTRLEKLTINEGTARAAFSEELDKGVAGSMRVTTIREQIERTLLQFPTVERVVIEVDGRVDDVLQP